MRIVIGTRGSALALWQANWVKERLAAAGYEAESRVLKTAGDTRPEASLSRSGTKGLFIKEIEEALLEGSIDLAVHSLKDLPIDQPAGLEVAAVPKRDDPRDAFISRSGLLWNALPAGSSVGTSSLRRIAQLRALRRDLDIVPLRGNVDTRLRKLDRGDCDALVLAAAGLDRLGLPDRASAYFSLDEMCPAVGQGALAIEIRKDHPDVARAVQPLEHLPTHQAVRAERAVLAHLGGGCQTPIAAHAAVEGGKLLLRGVVASLDGSEVFRASAVGSLEEPERLGVGVAQDLLRQGARAVLEKQSGVRSL